EGDPGRGARVDQVGILAQEAVARMDRVGAAHLRHADDLVYGEIGGDRPHPFTDPVCLVRLEAVERELVLLRVDGDRALPEFVCRPHHANRDLAAIGDQDLVETLHGEGSRIHAAGTLLRAAACAMRKWLQDIRLWCPLWTGCLPETMRLRRKTGPRSGTIHEL